MINAAIKRSMKLNPRYLPPIIAKPIIEKLKT